MSFVTLDFETYWELQKPAHIPPKKDGGRGRFSLTDMTYEEYICHPELFKVHCVGIQIDDGEPFTVYGDEIEWYLKTLFYPGNDHTLLAHNNMFDAAILAWHYGVRAGRYQCTKMMSQALWAQASSSLKKLAQRVFPDDESLRKGDGLVPTAGVWDLPWPILQALMVYCRQDVNLTFRIYRELWPIFPDKELDLIDWAVRCFVHSPFDLDRPRLTAYLETAEAELAALVKASGVPQKVLASNDQFAAYLKEHHDIEVQRKASPTPKNPDNECWALAKDDLPFIDMQAQYPELDHIWKAKLAISSTIGISRAQRMLRHHELNPAGRLALGLNANAAHTKRFGGMNKVNAQNFPRGGEHRKSVIAPEGYVIVVRDLSNIEGRLNAWNAQADWKLAAFARGEDLYNDLASDIYGRPIDRKRKEIGPDGEEYEPDFKEGFVAKTCELGLGYQTGAPKLRITLATSQARVLVSLDEAEQMKNTWRAKNKEIVQSWAFAEKIIWDMASKGMRPYYWNAIEVQYGRLILPSGLPLTYPKLGLENPEDPRSGFSYWNGKYFTNLYGGKLIENVVQAYARIVLTDHLLEIDAWLRDRFPGTEAQVGLTVHDELLAIAPEEHADEVLEHMAVVMSKCPDWCNDGSLVLHSEGGYAREYSK